MTDEDPRVDRVYERAGLSSDERQQGAAIVGEADAAPLQRIRDLIEARAVELGISLAALSRAIGKNASYMHHFLKRGTPSYIQEHDCAVLAARLGLPEEALMHPAKARAVRQVAPLVRGEHVPLYLQADEMTLASVRAQASRCIRPGADLIAVRMQTGRGRLEPGDVVYLAREPARIGDTVFAIVERRLAGWGRLLEATDDIVAIEATNGSFSMPGGKAEILRVVAISTVS